MPFGFPTPVTRVTATGDNNIDALLTDYKWTDPAVTFSFTDNINDYEFNANYPNLALRAPSFQTLYAIQRDVARKWLGEEYSNVSLLTPIELTGASDRDATIRVAMSRIPNPGTVTAFGYYPANTVQAGDAWFNPNDYNLPVIGNYAYHTFGHELGHTLGLKHGHELDSPFGVRDVIMNSDRDSMEFSIMTYRSYVGHDPVATNGYTNEDWGYAQSLMMYDIRAIQELYGANFNSNAGNTAYTFSTGTGEMFINGVGQGTPGANRVFRTIWDGNGIDTYDFSNYGTDLSVNLAPGAWSDVDVNSNFQSAILDTNSGRTAVGQVFNALQYKGDGRSLIENASGGFGNDSITGNSADNLLKGNCGNDTLDGGAGKDALLGETGNDYLVGGTGRDILTGGKGADQFAYTTLGDSLLSNYDVITDFTWDDKIDGSGSVIAATLTTSIGKAASLGAEAIAAVLNQHVFDANIAKAFTVKGQSGTFVALNNAVDGFNAANDSIIFLKDFTHGAVSVV